MLTVRSLLVKTISKVANLSSASVSTALQLRSSRQYSTTNSKSRLHIFSKNKSTNQILLHNSGNKYFHYNKILSASYAYQTSRDNKTRVPMERELLHVENDTVSYQSLKNIASVPRYVIDLDQPPETRWNQLADDYKDQWHLISTSLKQDLQGALGKIKGSIVESLITSVMRDVTRLGKVYYGKELKALAERSGMKLGRMVALQFAYEAAACCTSIVVPDSDNNNHHIRTMDWGMDHLGPLTVEIEFVRGGQTVFIATTFAGYMGILTGMKPGVCSVSVNFRNTGGSMWTNVKKAMASAWPIGFLVREVLESATTFDQAVTWLANSELIAPCYFTVAGANPGEGCLITRRQSKEEHRKTLGEDTPFVVQTNIDHWSDNEEDDILWSIRRRSIVNQKLPALAKVTEDTLWNMMSREPIINGLTIYGTYMNPKDGVLHTRLPIRGHGFKSFEASNNLEDFMVVVPVEALKDDALYKAVITKEKPPLPRCVRCNDEFDPDNNHSGQCIHTGTWHASYSDCNYIKCAFGLVNNIGKQHWSCCYSVSFESTVCSKSKKHQAPQQPQAKNADN